MDLCEQKEMNSNISQRSFDWGIDVLKLVVIVFLANEDFGDSRVLVSILDVVFLQVPLKSYVDFSFFFDCDFVKRIFLSVQYDWLECIAVIRFWMWNVDVLEIGHKQIKRQDKKAIVLLFVEDFLFDFGFDWVPKRIAFAVSPNVFSMTPWISEFD